jgi:hypothetical protein
MPDRKKQKLMLLTFSPPNGFAPDYNSCIMVCLCQPLPHPHPRLSDTAGEEKPLRSLTLDSSTFFTLGVPSETQPRVMPVFQARRASHFSLHRLNETHASAARCNKVGLGSTPRASLTVPKRGAGGATRGHQGKRGGMRLFLLVPSSFKGVCLALFGRFKPDSDPI